jgi:hypothetical protein
MQRETHQLWFQEDLYLHGASASEKLWNPGFICKTGIRRDPASQVERLNKRMEMKHEIKTQAYGKTR